MKGFVGDVGRACDRPDLGGIFSNPSVATGREAYIDNLALRYGAEIIRELLRKAG